MQATHPPQRTSFSPSSASATIPPTSSWKRPLTRLGNRRIFCFCAPTDLARYASRGTFYLYSKGGRTMSVMCSLAVCKAQQGMCGHEKAMLSVALLAAVGLGAYFLIG